MAMQGPEVVITADTDKAKASVDKLLAHIDKTLNRVTDRTDSHMQKLTRRVDRGFNTMSKSIRRSLLGISGIFAALFGHRMVQQIFNTTNAFQGLQNVFNTFAADAEEGRAQMEFLTKESQRLGFEITTLGAAYQKMFAAGRITGFTSEKIQEIFTSVGEAAAVAGMDSRQFEGALRALHQMMSKGKVQAEELRGQLGEHLPGAFEIAAEAMGVTTKQLDKMLSTGDVTAVELFENFPRVLREKYGPGLAKALTLPRRELERLKNDIQLAIKEIDDGTNALFASILSVVRKVVGSITQFFDEEMSESLERLSIYIRAIPDITSAAVKHLIERFRPLFPAFELIGKVARDTFQYISDFIVNKMDFVWKFIAFTFGNFPAIFAEFGRRLGTSFAFVVEAITHLWRDGIDYIAAKFDSWLLGLRIGLKSIRLFFSDMMVSVVGVVDSGLQGLGDKVVAMADLAGVVLPDSWAAGVRDAGMAIKSSSANLISDMVKNNDRIYMQIENLKDARSDAQDTATRSLAQLVKNQSRNYEVYIDRSVAGIRQLNQDVRNTADATEEFKLEVGTSLEYFENILDATKMEEGAIKKVTKATQALKTEVQQVEEVTKEIDRHYDRIADSISSNLSSAFDEFIENGKLDFADLANSIAKDITKIQFKELIADPISEALSAGLKQGLEPATGSGGNIFTGLISGMSGMFSGMSSWFSGLFAAEGAAFGRQGVREFAKGGVFTNSIVDSPTLFKFADGAGIMGEAGPEAIMPLKRGRGGKLGVAVEGGGPQKVENHYSFNIEGVTDLNSFNESEAQIGSRMIAMINSARSNM